MFIELQKSGIALRQERHVRGTYRSSGAKSQF